MRAALGSEPRLVGRLLRIEDALWTSPVWLERMGPGSTGETVVALYGVGGEDAAGNPSLSAEDAEKVRSALEAALGAPAEILHDFDPPLSPRGGQHQLSRRAGSPPERPRWLAALKLSATERKTATGRTFDIAPKDRKKRSFWVWSWSKRPPEAPTCASRARGKLNLLRCSPLESLQRSEVLASISNGKVRSINMRIAYSATLPSPVTASSRSSGPQDELEKRGHAVSSSP
jgi:hypothetical protein